MEKKSKVVKMEAKTSTKETKKLSYEELEQIANSLNAQCKNLYGQLQECQKMLANFNDIGMLLSILKESENFEPSFIERCSKKVEEVVNQMLDSAEKKENKAE